MWKRLFCGLTAAALLCTVGACSKESLKRMGYETLLGYSDQKNAGDPAGVVHLLCEHPSDTGGDGSTA